MQICHAALLLYSGAFLNREPIPARRAMLRWNKLGRQKVHSWSAGGRMSTPPIALSCKSQGTQRGTRVVSTWEGTAGDEAICQLKQPGAPWTGRPPRQNESRVSSSPVRRGGTLRWRCSRRCAGAQTVPPGFPAGDYSAGYKARPAEAGSPVARKIRTTVTRCRRNR